MARPRVTRQPGTRAKKRPNRGVRNVRQDTDSRQLAGSKIARKERLRRKRTI